jgi:hypothetical protein
MISSIEDNHEMHVPVSVLANNEKNFWLGFFVILISAIAMVDDVCSLS